MAAAERLLSYRPRSHRELSLRLRRRFPDEIVQAVLEHLAAAGLVNDETFVQFWVEARRRDPRSRAALVRELMAKGIPRATAEARVGAVDEEEGARALARRMARREGEDAWAFSRRLAQSLHRKGFPGDVVRTTLNHLRQEGRLDTPP